MLCQATTAGQTTCWSSTTSPRATTGQRPGDVPNSSFLTVTGNPRIYGWLGVKDWTGGSGELSPSRLWVVVDSNTRVTRNDGSHAALRSVASAPSDGR